MKGKIKTDVTKAQVRSLTLNAKPQVPVVYEEACKALAQCRTLDDAKLFDNKADALAAWAKIFHDDVAGREARALKLHAYAKMGKLAEDLRPRGSFAGRRGGPPGPGSLLLEHGMSPSASRAAVYLSRNPKELEKFTNERKPPAPITAARVGAARNAPGTAAWKQWTHNDGPRNSASAILRFDPKLAAQMTKDEAKLAIVQVKKLEEWCDEFFRFAAKAKLVP